MNHLPSATLAQLLYKVINSVLISEETAALTPRFERFESLILIRFLPSISFSHKISADSSEISACLTNQLLTSSLFHSCILLGSWDSSKPDNHITNQHKIVKISPKVNSEWTNRLKIVMNDGPARWMGEMSVRRFTYPNPLLNW